MCQALPRSQQNYSEHNILPPLSTPKMLVFSKVLSTSLIFHPLPEPSLCLCGFILFLNPYTDDSQRPASSHHTSSAEYSKGTSSSKHPKPNSVATLLFQHFLGRSSPPYSPSHALQFSFNPPCLRLGSSKGRPWDHGTSMWSLFGK